MQFSQLNRKPKELTSAQPASFTAVYNKKKRESYSSSQSDCDVDGNESNDDDDGWSFVPQEMNKSQEKDALEKEIQETNLQEDESLKQNDQLIKIELQQDQDQQLYSQLQQEQQSQDSCDDQWIASNNIAQKLQEQNKQTDHYSQSQFQNIQPITVTIATSDFAMQNVAMQIGIPVISSRTGIKITKLKTYCLICDSCKNIQPSNDKQFCQFCGNHCLRKTSLYIHKNGTITYFINPIKRISAKGTKYPLPMPKGGRKNNDIVLCEDQMLFGLRGRLVRKLNNQKIRQSEISDMGQFIDGTSTKFTSAQGAKDGPSKFSIRLEYGMGKKNPNFSKKRYQKKKKNRA